MRRKYGRPVLKAIGKQHLRTLLFTGSDFIPARPISKPLEPVGPEKIEVKPWPGAQPSVLDDS